MSDIHYPNPPILEAIVELHMRPDIRWDGTAPGRMAAQMVDLGYSGTESKLVLLAPDGETVERTWFLSEDRKDIVQVGRDALIVNRVRPYLGWNAFRSRVMSAHAVFAAHFPPAADIERVMVRYINRFDFPELSMVEYHQFIKFGVSVSPKLRAERIVANFGAVAELIDKTHLAIVKVSANALPREPHPAFILDIVAQSIRVAQSEHDRAKEAGLTIAEPELVQFETRTIEQQIDDMHAAIGSAFEDSITDLMRGRFK